MLFTYLTATLCLMNLQSSMVLVKLSSLTYHWRGSSCQGPVFSHIHHRYPLSDGPVSIVSSGLLQLPCGCHHKIVQWGANPLNNCLSLSYMSYANQASPYFLGCLGKPFLEVTYKSDVLVVGVSATPPQRSCSSHHGFCDCFFFINGFNCKTNKKLHS